MRILFWLMAVPLCFGVALGFGGAIHPAADSLSLLRMPLGALCLFLATVRGPALLRVLLLISGLAAAITTVPPWLLAASGGELTLYSKNLWYRNPELVALADDIRSSEADVVTLQEVSRHNDVLLDALKDDYPHQHLCRFSGWSGIAVLSRYPIKQTGCSSRRGAAAARISRDGQSVWVTSIHLPWPYPYGNMSAAQAAEALIDQLDGPIVIAGDFNIFPWASGVGRIRRASGTRLAGPIRPTFYLRGVPLLLDHVYAPGGGEVRHRPLLGSDHEGLLATLRLSP